ncbi:MAG: hypothetical protein RQ757_02680 [Pseudomonadales bacterium]|nr:hypothetical protein [Pseudomonadales bacterium]
MTTRHLPDKLFPRLVRALLLLILVVFAATGLLAVLIVQISPLVERSPAPGMAETRQLEQVIVDNSPAQFNSSGATSRSTLQFDTAELNLLANFAAQNLPWLEGVASRFQLADGQLDIDLSIPWPDSESPAFLNSRLVLRQDSGMPRLQAVTLGNLALPTFLVTQLEALVWQELEALSTNYPELAFIQQNIQAIEIGEQTLNIHLDWQPQQLLQLRDQAQFYFIEPQDRARILFYYQQISALSHSAATDSQLISLHELISALFTTAAERTAHSFDPIAENRSLLQALSLYVNALDLNLLITEPPPGLTLPRALTVTLHRRADLAQHFVSASAIAASAGAGIAEILSNSKEVYDARYRSGFSFSDMTANAAGMMFGTLATSDRASAQHVQQLMGRASSEADYMPDVSRDMRGISEQDFMTEFSDRNSPAYLSRLQAIEDEISSLPFYTQGYAQGIQ